MQRDKKLLLLGASYYQIPAITAAQKLGFHVIALDKNPGALGNRYADEAFPVDIIDVPSVIKLAIEKDIRGVFTMQSDIAVPTVGAINDQLRLPGIGLETARVCSNKIAMRQRLKQAGISQPRFDVVSGLKAAINAASMIGFPCIIKTPDSSGSRGVTKVKSLAEVEFAFSEAQKYTKSEVILVEEYIKGTEIGAQTFSQNGECGLVLLHNDTVSPPPYLIPTGHSFPIILGDFAKKETTAAIAAAVCALGINDGPSNVDLILGLDGKPHIIEIGARIGATCLPELVHYHTGIDWIRESIRVAMGEPANLSVSHLRTVAARILEATSDGVLKQAVPDEELLDDPRLIEWEIVTTAGDRISKLRKGPDRIGKVLATGKDVKEAVAFVESFQAKLRLSIAND